MNNNGFVEYIIDLLSEYGDISSRKMFGGYGLYSNKVIFAIIIDNELYFKVDNELSEEYKSAGSYPFTYDRNGKTIALSYFYISVGVIEDPELLKIWFNKSLTIAIKNKTKKH
jgi:DNA transformation protein and related proteins